jgi:hypothetical protein
LQYLSDFGHELDLVQVWATEDREPAWEGQLDLTDAETDAKLEIGFDDAARRNYLEAFDTYARDIQRVGLRNGGRYVGISTATTIEEAVFGPLVRSGGLE